KRVEAEDLTALAEQLLSVLLGIAEEIAGRPLYGGGQRQLDQDQGERGQYVKGSRTACHVGVLPRNRSTLGSRTNRFACLNTAAREPRGPDPLDSSFYSCIRRP